MTCPTRFDELVKSATTHPVLLLVRELVFCKQLAGEERAPRREYRRDDGDEKAESNTEMRGLACDGQNDNSARQSSGSKRTLPAEATHEISGTIGSTTRALASAETFNLPLHQGASDGPSGDAGSISC